MKLKINLTAERFCVGLHHIAQKLITMQLVDRSVCYRELVDSDADTYVDRIVYPARVIMEREGRYQCRFWVIAYEHPIGAKAAGRIVRAYRMEYPLIRYSSGSKSFEYTEIKKAPKWKQT